jgi:hypothetical protein
VTDTAPTSPPELSEQSKRLIVGTVAHNVEAHPVQAAKQLAYLNRMDEKGKLDVYDAFRRDTIAAQLHDKHFCRECGRELRDPDSKKAGIGPDCAEKLAQAGG